MAADKNVYGDKLQPCGSDPITGYTRTGTCETGPADRGSHTVCAEVSDEFLIYSRAMGNDLISPVPEYDFPGLVPGNRWCLCVLRWKEALEAGVAPPVVLESTHENALRHVSLEQLQQHAVKK
ncbi:MAG: DUF2237 domain-containing protein [Desulfobacterales bacterium]|jgi:hypothetical protein